MLTSNLIYAFQVDVPHKFSADLGHNFLQNCVKWFGDEKLEGEFASYSLQSMSLYFLAVVLHGLWNIDL